MAGLISISPAHYEFLMSKAKEAIRHDFDNDGNWITRQTLIEECESNEMPEDFIHELQADQNVEVGYEKEMAAISRREFQQSTMGL